MSRYTGGWTDFLRRGWRSRLSRFERFDHYAHAAYLKLQRLQYAPRLVTGPMEVARYLRAGSPWPEREPVTVHVRPLAGATVELRPHTTDATVVHETFRDMVHPPPPQIVARGVRRIVDLGANIGLTAADNALRFPQARILAVELDPGNAAAARRHIAPWADRIELLQGAVWVEDGEVAYENALGTEYGFRVSPAASARTRAFSMDSILSHLDPGERVDYVKMDIEGVEARLLSGPAAAWTERIDSISLQVHGAYTLDDCARDLEALGFAARVDRRRVDYMLGVRHGL